VSNNGEDERETEANSHQNEKKQLINRGLYLTSARSIEKKKETSQTNLSNLSLT
jgi:hypothetical protein